MVMLLKKEWSLYTIICIDLTLSFIYFKQIWAPGAEVEKMGLQLVLLQPGVQLYGLIGIWFFSNYLGLKESEVPITKRSSLKRIGFVLFFIFLPLLPLLLFKGGLRVVLIFVWGFLDPITAKYYWGYSYNQLRRRAILLWAVSFALSFISMVMCDLFGYPDSTNTPFFFGCFYNLYMAYLHYKSGSSTGIAADTDDE